MLYLSWPLSENNSNINSGMNFIGTMDYLHSNENMQTKIMTLVPSLHGT